MLTTMRLAWPWTPWLAVLIFLATLTTGAVEALAAGRILTPQDSVSIKVVKPSSLTWTPPPALKRMGRSAFPMLAGSGRRA